MRLIDADDLYEYANKFQTYCGRPLTRAEQLLIKAFASTIKETKPTAFDKEKVKQDIKKYSRKMCTLNYPYQKYYRAIGTRKCEEIIEAGGINGE